MNVNVLCSPRIFFDSHVGRPKRPTLEHDREQQHPDREADVIELVRIAELLDAFEDREQSAQAEQHRARR